MTLRRAWSLRTARPRFGSLAVRACRLCAALVPADAVDVHERWHSAAAAALGGSTAPRWDGP